MPAQPRRRTRRAALVVALAAALAMVTSLTGLPGSVAHATAPSVATASPAAVAAPGPVELTPASGTPRFTDAPANAVPDQIRQLVQCGSMMYAVGTFSQIVSGSAHLARSGVFSFSATPPYTVSSFNPNVGVGSTSTTPATVDTIAFNGSDCSHAYIGGIFTTVGGVAAKDIAEVDTTTGGLVTGFRHSASGRVETIASSNGHLLAGGIFTSINGSTADPYFTSLSPTTGANDGYLSLGISGNYNYTDQVGNHSVTNPTEVYDQQISPDGSREVIEGDFTSAGGQARQQVAMLDLGTKAATTDAWYPTEPDNGGYLGFNGECSYNVPFYVQAASWSPDGSTLYFADTGYRPSNAPGDNPPTDPRAGLCDAAVAFSTAADASLVWINYTGCDSLFSTAADGSTVFFGGHERWSENPNGCDAAGTNPAPIDAPGMEGLSPSDGTLISNPTRARGLGADDMLFTSAGLWVASDNYQDSSMCGGVSEHAGICLLPYQNPVATAPTVTGSATVDHTVTCAEPKQPAVSGQPTVTTTYTWLVGGTPVAHATSYLIPGSAYGKPLTCQASLQRSTGPVSTAASPPATVAIGRALTATKAPTLARAARVGHTDRVHRGIWSPRATTYTFQWYISGKPVKGATSPSYTVPPRAKNRRLRCRVTASAVGYAAGSRLTAPLKVAKK